MNLLKELNVIVLAAGSSQRMGAANKLFLPYGESTILRSTISNILNAGFQKALVVTGHDHEKVTDHLVEAFSDLEIIYNPEYLSGQMCSIKKGLERIDNQNPFLITLADMPLVQPEDYIALATSFSNNDKEGPIILRPVSKDHQPGNPVLFSFVFKKHLLQNEDAESAKSVISKNRDSFIPWETSNPNYFSDIDTPEDYEKLIS